MKAINIYRQFPEVIIATQIMVGFPTETEQDFQKSIDLVSVTLVKLFADAYERSYNLVV